MGVIPVIDLSPLRESQPRDLQSVTKAAQEIDRACRDTGFFYISGHGVSQDGVQRLLQLAQRLFALPQALKDTLDARHSPLARGYNSLEHGKHSCTPEDGQQDAKESFTLGMERAAGDRRPPSPMHGPNLWPPEEALPGWRQEAQAAVQQLLAVARLLMRGLALALRQPEDFFTSKCRDPVAQMVLFSYPPAPASGSPARGCGAHTDCGFLTLVVQDEPGIEVQLADGSWYQAPSVPGTFLVNLGDMMARWTGDAYRSTVHRVVNRSATAPRHSLVFFCNCDFDALVETIGNAPHDSTHDGGTDGGSRHASSDTAGGKGKSGGSPGKRYPPVKAGEYILQKLGLMYG